MGLKVVSQRVDDLVEQLMGSVASSRDFTFPDLY
jgi:hypothetical protein